MSNYKFGDSGLAAERLRLLAEVFAPATRAFLGQLPRDSRWRIADLGCGPGYTSRLLAELFATSSVVGLDRSQAFVEQARQDACDRVSFAVADVTQKLLGGPFDLMYSRYLLTHLADPLAAIVLWRGQLAPRGQIVIEENEWIRTEVPAFARYLEIVAAMLAGGGQKLYLGGELNRLCEQAGLERVMSEVAPIEVDSCRAAGIFLPNLRTWREQPYIQENVPRSEIDSLEQELADLADGQPTGRAITFGRRRLILRRR